MTQQTRNLIGFALHFALVMGTGVLVGYVLTIASGAV